MNYLVPSSVFQFKSFKDPNSSWFITFICLLLDSGVIFSAFSNFHKLKSVDLISWGKRILQSDWIIWFPFLYFSVKNFKGPNSSSFIRFQYILHNSGVEPNSSSFIRFQRILHDSGIAFSDFWNLFQLKTGGPNLLGGGGNSAERLNYLVSPSAFQF